MENNIDIQLQEHQLFWFLLCSLKERPLNISPAGLVISMWHFLDVWRSTSSYNTCLCCCMNRIVKQMTWKCVHWLQLSYILWLFWKIHIYIFIYTQEPMYTWMSLFLSRCIEFLQVSIHRWCLCAGLPDAVLSFLPLPSWCLHLLTKSSCKLPRCWNFQAVDLKIQLSTEK